MCLNSTRNISFRLVDQRLELNELQVTQTCFLSALLNQYPIKPSIWLRYIDDILTMWNESEDKLKDILTYINMINPAIQFTQAYSFKSINFLDALVTLTADATVSKDLYTKPTNTHQYLHMNSCHPNHL